MLHTKRTAWWLSFFRFAEHATSYHYRKQRTSTNLGIFVLETALFSIRSTKLGIFVLLT
jgi:hypothetical protein